MEEREGEREREGEERERVTKTETGRTRERDGERRYNSDELDELSSTAYSTHNKTNNCRPMNYNNNVTPQMLLLLL